MISSHYHYAVIVWGFSLAYQLFQSVQQQRTPPLFAYQLAPPVIKWIFSPLLASSCRARLPPSPQTDSSSSLLSSSVSVPSPQLWAASAASSSSRLQEGTSKLLTFYVSTGFLSVLSPNPNTPATFFKFSFSFERITTYFWHPVRHWIHTAC